MGVEFDGLLNIENLLGGLFDEGVELGVISILTFSFSTVTFIVSWLVFIFNGYRFGFDLKLAGMRDFDMVES